MSRLPTQFMGLPVVEFDPANPPRQLGDLALRVRQAGHLQRVAQLRDAKSLQGLILVEPAEEDLKQLKELHSQFPQLRGLILQGYLLSLPGWEPVLNAYPGLEAVHLQSHNLFMFPFRHISLRRLALESYVFVDDVISGLAQCVIPQLETLELIGNMPLVDRLANFLREPPFPNVTTLKLRRQPGMEQIMDALVESPLAGQLVTLDLSSVSFSDVAAQIFRGNRDRFPALEKLILRFHNLSELMESRLRRLNLKVLTGFSDLGS